MKDVVYQKVEQMWYDNLRALAGRLVKLVQVRAREYPGLMVAYEVAVNVVQRVGAISAEERSYPFTFAGAWRAVMGRVRDEVMEAARKSALSHGGSNAGPPCTQLMAAQDMITAREAATAVVSAAASGGAVSVDRLTAATATLQEETNEAVLSRLQSAKSAYFRSHPEDRGLSAPTLRQSVERRVKEVSLDTARSNLEESVR